MAVYLTPSGQVTEPERNAMLPYPYILKQVISHGRAAEILGIRKNDLIDIYDKMGGHTWTRQWMTWIRNRKRTDKPKGDEETGKDRYYNKRIHERSGNLCRYV